MQRPESPRRRRRLLASITIAVVVALLPGWRGTLETVDHAVLLAETRAAAPGRVFGTARGDGSGGEWHVQYVTSGAAVMLRGLGLKAVLPSLVAPDFVAHIPSGSPRADAYYRVRTAAHWPWWRPGGGVNWVQPSR